MLLTEQILKNFKEFVRDQHLIKPEEGLLVAVSGGVDSVVLLDLLHQVQSEWKLRLKVIHLNHSIRGREADRDETFVRKLADAYGLEGIFEKQDVPAYRKEHRLGLEEAAREVRYRFYERALAQTGFQKVALGHQKNDQAETILANFLRGAGMAGLSGIPVQRGPFIRPLLWASREDILQYAREKELEFQQDSTNADVDYRRNRIRRELIPYLKEHFNPEIVEQTYRVGRIFSEIESFLIATAHDSAEDCILLQNHSKIILDIDKFSKYFNIIKKYILRECLVKLGVAQSRLTFTMYDALLSLAEKGKKGRKIPVGSHITVLIDQSGLVIQRDRPIPEQHPLTVEPGRDYTLSDYGVVFQTQFCSDPQEFQRSVHDPTIEYVDWERLQGKKLLLRPWRKGDRFFPLGMAGQKKISDFLIDEKVPLHERPRILVFTADEEIVWICGYRLDNRFRVTKSTKKSLKLAVEKIRS
ncbi:MAG: tRNA lysidine(34) synthetase TilS [Calditrichaeota bacterium]|nr:tRNA lysidine(34) synthetase TilS [Calditrichota bacterium]